MTRFGWRRDGSGVENILDGLSALLVVVVRVLNLGLLLSLSVGLSLSVSESELMLLHLLLLGLSLSCLLLSLDLLLEVGGDGSGGERSTDDLRRRHSTGETRGVLGGLGDVVRLLRGAGLEGGVRSVEVVVVSVGVGMRPRKRGRKKREGGKEEMERRSQLELAKV